MRILLKSQFVKTFQAVFKESNVYIYLSAQWLYVVLSFNLDFWVCNTSLMMNHNKVNSSYIVQLCKLPELGAAVDDQFKFCF